MPTAELHQQDQGGRPGDDLGPAALVAQGTAAHLAGDAVRAVRLLQRAFQAYLDRADQDGRDNRHQEDDGHQDGRQNHREDGDDRRAPDDALRVAFLLAMVFGTTGQPALFNGWLARAQRLLAETLPEHPGRDGDGSHSSDSSDGSGSTPSLGRGYVAVLELHQAMGSGGFGVIGPLAAEVLEAGRRHREPDLQALGLAAQGRFTIYSGDVPGGLALLDEAMAGVLTGETSPLVTGLAWCAAIEGCQEIGAIDRLGEWTEALGRWCTDQPGLAAFTGECALHTGQVLTLHGAWTEAEEEFAAARGRFERRGVTWAAGRAERERGDLLRRRGEDAAAEAAYQAAAENGCDPQPGLALLWLARGQHAAATAAVQRCLTETTLPAHRVGLLPAALDVLLAVGRAEEAEPLLTELDELAAVTGCAPVAAAAAHGHARVELARHDAGGALPYARKAVQGWGGIGCPFEAARSRVTLARALAELGDVQSCRGELDAARSAFARLEAAPSVEEAEALLADVDAGRGLGQGADHAPDGLTVREVEVLRLVASGRSNRQIATALSLSEKTVARHLSNIFTKVDVGSRTEAAAYAFEHGLA